MRKTAQQEFDELAQATRNLYAGYERLFVFWWEKLRYMGKERGNGIDRSASTEPEAAGSC